MKNKLCLLVAAFVFLTVLSVSCGQKNENEDTLVKKGNYSDTEKQKENETQKTESGTKTEIKKTVDIMFNYNSKTALVFDDSKPEIEVSADIIKTMEKSRQNIFEAEVDQNNRIISVNQADSIWAKCTYVGLGDTATAEFKYFDKAFRLQIDSKISDKTGELEEYKLYNIEISGPEEKPQGNCKLVDFNEN